MRIERAIDGSEAVSIRPRIVIRAGADSAAGPRPDLGVEAGRQDASPQETEWDGRDEGGELLPPGIYLLSVAPNAEFATSAQILPLGIAY